MDVELRQVSVLLLQFVRPDVLAALCLVFNRTSQLICLLKPLLADFVKQGFFQAGLGEAFERVRSGAVEHLDSSFNLIKQSESGSTFLIHYVVN